MTNYAAAKAIAEAVIRDVANTHPDLPIRAAFYRGRNPGNIWNPIREETIETAAVKGGWFVLAKPSLFDVALSAWEPDILGGGIIGGLGDAAEVSCLPYPRLGDEVDLTALAGDAFRAELLDAIRAKAAVVDTARAAR